MLDMREEEGRLVIVISGEIDHHSAAAVRNQIDRRLGELSSRSAVMDLSKIEFMDSSGLGLILGRYTKARELGTEVIIKNPSKRTEKIFRMAGTAGFIKITYDKEKKR
jgi:stage II sporulation protein AA (anti-sigma F factor antagonist)